MVKNNAKMCGWLTFCIRPVKICRGHDKLYAILWGRLSNNSKGARRVDIRVRPASVGDEELILDFILQKAAADKRTKTKVKITAEKIRTHAFSEEPSFYVLFAVDGETPVACLIYYFTFVAHICDPVLYIEQTIVREKYRNAAVIMKLFSEAAHVAKARGCNCIATRLFNDNKPAIEFLESTGAEVMSEIDLLAITGDGFDKLISGE